MPKYDFRCDSCGQVFELTRSFNAAADPAACPRDGAVAARIFSPPLDLLVYGREPIVPSGRVTIPPGALSCHDHGPSPVAALADGGGEGASSGSRWHAHGSGHDDLRHPHGHGPGHADGHHP